MNEAQTRAELIDPKQKESGWGVVEGSKILREHPITKGKLKTGHGRAKPLFADYVLVYKGRKLAAMEAKSDELEVGEGVGQAKDYAFRLHLETTFASNGKEIYQISMETGKEGLIDKFPTPDELWNKTFNIQNLQNPLLVAFVYAIAFMFPYAIYQLFLKKQPQRIYKPKVYSKIYGGSSITVSIQACGA